MFSPPSIINLKFLTGNYYCMSDSSELPERRPLSPDTNPFIRPIEYREGGKGGRKVSTRFQNLAELFEVPEKKTEPFGILAANCFTPEMTRAVAGAAVDTCSPGIIQVAESQIGYALEGADNAEKLSRYVQGTISVLSDLFTEAGYQVPFCLHIDHLQKDDDLVGAAVEAGATSIELDYSKGPADKRAETVLTNIDRCMKHIPFLREHGVSYEVEEGEIGDAKAREASTREQIMELVTKPEWAVPLVKGTEPDGLAIFIGSAHGEYKDKPVVVYDAIQTVRSALRKESIDVPIVLHGGTGQGNDGFRHAIRCGTRKINYASRWWTILQNHLKNDKTGAAILAEMEKAAPEGKGARYAFGQFKKQLYKDVGQEVFKAAEHDMYRHAVYLMSDGFCSAGQARKYRKILL